MCELRLCAKQQDLSSNMVTVQIDVEGCELEALQGIQPHHWSQINQVSHQVRVYGVKLPCSPGFCTGYAATEQSDDIAVGHRVWLWQFRIHVAVLT